jgi:DNA-binding response OmpR family regulator
MLTIVVVEEDISMRTLFCEWLAEEGYSVRGRADHRGPQVLDVDLVVVDLIDLPNQGAQTVREVKKNFPGAALVATSTRLNGPLTSDSVQARAIGVSGLVPKPCTKRQLLDAVITTIGVAG